MVASSSTELRSLFLPPFAAIPSPASTTVTGVGKLRSDWHVRPGIDSDIASTVRASVTCQMLQPSLQPEPLLNDDHPQKPFESVSTDFFAVAGNHSLSSPTDSGWPVVGSCKAVITASFTIRICRYIRKVFPFALGRMADHNSLAV